MIFVVLCLLLFTISCTSENSPKSELTSYCIRECVLETAASEICDTQCRYAVDKLYDEYSKVDFVNLEQGITQDDKDSLQKLKSSLELCKDVSE